MSPRIVPGKKQAFITYLLNIAQDGTNTLYVNIYNELQNLKEHKVEVWIHLKMITDSAFTDSVAQINWYYIQKQNDNAYKNKIKNFTQESLRFCTLKLAKKLARKTKMSLAQPKFSTSKLFPFFNRWYNSKRAVRLQQNFFNCKNFT